MYPSMPRMLPQNMPDPTGQSPYLATDPRAKVCAKHDVFLFPEQVCPLCYAERVEPKP